MNEAKQAILAMALADPEYWRETLRSRCVGGVGPRTLFTSVEELNSALLEAEWEPYYHLALADDCRAFVAPIPGLIGVEPINPEHQYVLRDPKVTGKVSAVRVDPPGAPTDLVPFTVLICGEEEGELRAFTFHPGEPVRPSVCTEPESDRWLSGKTCLNLGLAYAKIG
jgi:hypothetical protein